MYANVRRSITFSVRNKVLITICRRTADEQSAAGSKRRSGL